MQGSTNHFLAYGTHAQTQQSHPTTHSHIRVELASTTPGWELQVNIYTHVPVVDFAFVSERITAGLNKLAFRAERQANWSLEIHVHVNILPPQSNLKYHVNC